MTLEKTQNPHLVKYIVTHPQIYPYISEDGQDPNTFEAPGDPWIYLIIRATYGPLGLYGLVPQTSVVLEVHTCILPEGRGAPAAEAAQLLITWVWQNTEANRLVTLVPVYNRRALKYAQRAGLVEYGRNPASYKKDGKLWDTVLLGLTRPGV